MLTGTNLKYTKAHNLRAVLETVRLYGPMPRKDISVRTELRLQTVSNITRRLFEAGLIREVERLREGRGAPTSLLDLNPEGAFSIGLDFDREHFAGVLVDFAGTVRQKVEHDVRFPMPDEALGLMQGAVDDLISRQRIEKTLVWGVGVGLPGPLGISGNSVVTNIASPTAFPGWHNVPITEDLCQRLELPVYIENNATAAAVGERWYGRGRHIRDFFYIFFGVGLGGGLVVNGQPFEGHNGNAGEIGPVPVFSQNETGGVTRSKLGSHFDLAVISRTLGQRGIEVSRPEHLRAPFEEEDEDVMNWLEKGIEHLAPFVLAIECLVDPEAIFLGGRYPDVVIRYIKERLETALPPLRYEEGMAHPKLYCATAGENATAMGVATLPMYSSFAPIPEILMKHAYHPGIDAQALGG